MGGFFTGEMSIKIVTACSPSHSFAQDPHSGSFDEFYYCSTFASTYVEETRQRKELHLEFT